MIMEKKENRRLQGRIPKSKGRGKGKGIPGIEIIEAYRPMTTALGPRMTVSLLFDILNLPSVSTYIILLPTSACSLSYARGSCGI